MRHIHRPQDTRLFLFSREKWVSLNSPVQTCRSCKQSITPYKPKLSRFLLVAVFLLVEFALWVITDILFEERNIIAAVALILLRVLLLVLISRKGNLFFLWHLTT